MSVSVKETAHDIVITIGKKGKSAKKKAAKPKKRNVDNSGKPTKVVTPIPKKKKKKAASAKKPDLEALVLKALAEKKK